MNPFYYVLIAGVFAGAYQIFRKISSSQMDPFVAASMFSLVAGILGLAILLKQKFSLVKFISDGKLLILAIIAGVLILPVDYFVLKAYKSGVQLSIGTPVLVGFAAVLAVLFGIIILHEPIKLIKLVGIVLILSGIIILKLNS